MLKEKTLSPKVVSAAKTPTCNMCKVAHIDKECQSGNPFVNSQEEEVMFVRNQGGDSYGYNFNIRRNVHPGFQWSINQQVLNPHIDIENSKPLSKR